jgi:hypothetical protein
MLGVALALRTTGAACHQAAFKRCANHADVGCGLAGHDAAGGIADVGAIKAEANAADQILHVALAEVSVGAAGTDSSAVAARLDTAHERIEIADRRYGMRLEHLANGHCSPLYVAPATQDDGKRCGGPGQRHPSHPTRGPGTVRGSGTAIA